MPRRRRKGAKAPAPFIPDEIQGLIDVYGRGYVALSSLPGRVQPPPVPEIVVHLPRFIAELQGLVLAGDKPGLDRKALAVALRQVRRLVGTVNKFPSDTRANFLVEPFATGVILVGQSAGPLLASVDGVAVPTGPVLDLLRALEAGLRAVLPSLPRDARLYLLGILALIDQLMARLLQAGARVSLQVVRNAIEQIVLRIFQLRHVLSTAQFGQVMRPVYLFLERLQALAARFGVRFLGVGLLKLLAAFAAGFAVGYVITKIPIGGGRTVGDAIADSVITDVLFEFRYGTEADCDALFGAYVRARERRVRAELDSRSVEELRLALDNEINRLRAYLAGDCLDAGGRRTFERELRRVQRKLDELR